VRRAAGDDAKIGRRAAAFCLGGLDRLGVVQVGPVGRRVKKVSVARPREGRRVGVADGRADIGVGAFHAVDLDGLGYERIQIIEAKQLSVAQLSILRIAPCQFDQAAELVAE
jgi:hypothetical protein